MKDNQGGRLPYLKQITVLIIAVWLVTLLTSGVALDVLSDAVDAYKSSVRQYGWYTFGTAVVVTLITLVTMLVREIRKDI